MNKLILSILVCFILFIPTKAYSISGNKWLETCEIKLKAYPVGEMVCEYYLFGLADMGKDLERLNTETLKLVQERNPVNEQTLNTLKGFISPQLCIPSTVSPEQLKKIMIKWLNENPKELHIPLTLSFLNSMHESFPCKN
jgi:hypothetical protein